jgi:hypothetical protein
MDQHFPHRLSSMQRQAIQHQIDRLMRDHIGQPFRILREAGVVAELRDLLLADPEFSSPIPATVAARRGLAHSQTRPVQVARVQLEITAIPAQGLRQGAKVKTVDIAILHPECSLICAPRGPGDVLQQIASCELSAAIEVKASPSSDLSAGGAYARDVEALLYLARTFGVMGYFVLLDKSSALYGVGGITASPDHHDHWPRWMQSRPDAFHDEPDRSLGSRKRWPSNLQLKNIRLSNTPPARDVPHVEVWTIEQTHSQGIWRPTCRYAS